MDAWNLNSGPQACVASALLTGPSFPQPLKTLNEKKKNVGTVDYRKITQKMHDTKLEMITELKGRKKEKTHLKKKTKQNRKPFK